MSVVRLCASPNTIAGAWVQFTFFGSKRPYIIHIGTLLFLNTVVIIAVVVVVFSLFVRVHYMRCVKQSIAIKYRILRGTEDKAKWDKKKAHHQTISKLVTRERAARGRIQNATYDKINKILYSVTLLEFRSKVTNILSSHVNGGALFAPTYHTRHHTAQRIYRDGFSVR